ncbi:hypothetical protein Tco_0523565 [Tanacetum coccineum]
MKCVWLPESIAKRGGGVWFSRGKEKGQGGDKAFLVAKGCDRGAYKLLGDVIELAAQHTPALSRSNQIVCLALHEIKFSCQEIDNTRVVDFPVKNCSSIITVRIGLPGQRCALKSRIPKVPFGLPYEVSKDPLHKHKDVTVFEKLPET